MRKLDKSGATPRRLWRITAEAPRGEFVDPAEKLEKAAAPVPAPDELRESSWVRSSYDLLTGLEVTETAPGDLLEGYFDDPPRAVVPDVDLPGSASEWILRFALRMAEIDLQREPRDVIELAKRQWLSMHDLSPEAAADAEQRRAARS